jgi:hypothetical protein
MSALAYEAALAAYDAGLCVVPPKEDGTKAPDTNSWKQYQHRPSTRAEIATWYANGRSGVGYITGAVSGRLEVLDFDAVESYEAFTALAEAAGLTSLVERIEAGYLEATPSGGRHWFYRCDEIAGNTRLARRPKRLEEKEDEHDTIKVLIETRGEGGYIVAAPSNGRVHASGNPYRLLRGGPPTIATITPEERAELLTLARSLDELPNTDAREPHAGAASKGKPGESYNARGDVLALLQEHGWRLVYVARSGVSYLRRPGKDCGISATFGHAGTRYFYCFSTSTAFEAERAYSPFAVYTRLEHNGDFHAAAESLAAQGYGAHGATTLGSDLQNWPTMDAAALHGLAGDIVTAIDPHTESDPVAILFNTLVMFGNAVGRAAHARVGATLHHANEFAVLVGETARARKGTAHQETRRLFEHADAPWVARVVGGLSSGEGLIHAVRDASYKTVRGQEMPDDPGVADKRLLAVESEFASVLRVASRDGNTLSELLRRGFDGDDLQTLTRNAPLRATNPHISLLGHITKTELLRELTETSQANGWANRHLFALVRRSKSLPHGGALRERDVEALASRLRGAIHTARGRGLLHRDDEATRDWETAYPRLTADRLGMFGSITARAEAHVLRLSLIYALLEGDTAIRRTHLAAALAVWDYCEASARFIFGDATGDPVADAILRALRANGQMTQTQISALFANNQKAGRLQGALAALLTANKVRTWQGESDSGRPPSFWKAV